MRAPYAAATPESTKFRLIISDQCVRQATAGGGKPASLGGNQPSTCKGRTVFPSRGEYICAWTLQRSICGRLNRIDNACESYFGGLPTSQPSAKIDLIGEQACFCLDLFCLVARCGRAAEVSPCGPGPPHLLGAHGHRSVWAAGVGLLEWLQVTDRHQAGSQCPLWRSTWLSGQGPRRARNIPRCRAKLRTLTEASNPLSPPLGLCA